MKTTGNTIFMTGGTSGIGLELARRFRDLGNTVIISGRRKDLLDRIAAEDGIQGVVLDVADPAALEAVAAAHPDVNVLITMAGIMRAEDLHTPDLAVAEETIAINLLGTIRAIAAFTPQLRTRPDAAIVTVSSGLAFVPLAITPTYNATKAAVHSYTQSLRIQLADTGIQVVELVPPAVQTNLMNGAAPDPTWMPLAEYADESITLFQQHPEAEEILVDRVHFLRSAERENRHAQAVAALNTH
ncbi:SDR family NAD(P)-dependent oxidoreductase [Kribbella sandramycini]|uniref:SDR family NAD(P)-dependent oxidoreductase n=1 Tax=Kribbella sandramycini TaxID=60450 RepID=A0A7Y4L3S7_9ACTN|nr:SDR family NAD(P)-dependent oxidoreductase [Kribbella sandramycini]MBB6564965.1 short-subunit dehydrogenase involved in D-alanine esterification of teichoic acids [Kribbella sandramycini]NOL42661.1 SDR family NAD(P)-dependent oxidoreductase [Kribbella sandramycini]